MATYLVIVALFLGPLAAGTFVDYFVPASPAAKVVQWTEVFSPFSAVFNLPLVVEANTSSPSVDVAVFWGYLAFSLLYNLALLVSMMWLFRVRWRVSD